MSTVDELLGIAESIDDVITVDMARRTIDIPNTIDNIGVTSDDDVLSLNFKIARYYEGIDLSKFVIRVNILNANGEEDIYEVTDSQIVTEEKIDYIYFTWLVGRFTCQYKGEVKFNICMRLLNDTTVVKEFNTAIAELEVLEGLECGAAIVQEYPDLVAKWEAKILSDVDELSIKVNNTVTESLDLIADARKQAQKMAVEEETEVVIKWQPGVIDDEDGQFIKNLTDTNNGTSQFILLGRGSTITSTGVSTHVYSYNPNTQAYIKKVATLGENEVYTVTKEMLIRVTCGLNVNAIIISVTESLSGRVVVLEKEINQSQYEYTGGWYTDADLDPSTDDIIDAPGRKITKFIWVSPGTSIYVRSGTATVHTYWIMSGVYREAKTVNSGETFICEDPMGIHVSADLDDEVVINISSLLYRVEILEENINYNSSETDVSFGTQNNDQQILISSTKTTQYKSEITSTQNDLTLMAGNNVTFNRVATTSNGPVISISAAAGVTEDDIKDFVTKEWLNITETNLLDGIALTSGYFINGSSGNLDASASFSVSDYVDVSGYETIRISPGISHFVFFDSNYTKIGGVVRLSSNLPSHIYAVPTDAVYARFSVSNNSIDSVIVSDGSKYLDNEYITEEVSDKKNLVKPECYTTGYYLETNGKYIANTSYATSDYVDVSNYTRISVSNGIARFGYYDSNYIFISGQSFEYADHPTEIYKVPDNAKYAVFSTTVATISTSRICGYTDVRASKEDMYDVLRRVYYVDKNGGGDYTSLTECLADATRNFGSTVYVRAGVYDLEAECKALRGDTFFDDFTSSTSYVGITLKSAVHVIFDSRAVVKFEYDGSNSNVVARFAPFNSGRYGFTLENLTLIATNSRYCVHDERGGSTEQYVNKYLNCDFHFSTIGTSYIQCIGGGLGAGGEVVIKDCIFEADTDTRPVISYHNNNKTTATDSKSRIVFTGNMVKNVGSFRLTYMGNTQEMTTAIISNNSLGSEPYMIMEGTNQPYENTEIIGWNNVIRGE